MFEKSDVMNEYFKIMAKKEKENEKEECTCIVEEAHPEEVYVADALGDGGLVENEKEIDDKIINMINKMPTGSLVNRYAKVEVLKDLVKLADYCDDLGKTQLADKITEVVKEMCRESPLD